MKNTSINRVILLGIDGLDPNILERLMSIGDLPGCSRLRDTGTYRRLETIIPAQSPAVWSSMATGCNPGHHGIFDFITRKPENYLPIHSIVEPNPKNVLARRDSMFLPVRIGTAFWTVASQQQIPTTLVRWPVTFPPEKVHTHMLSGLGVLDLKGSVGDYTYYVTGSVPEDPDRKGTVISLAPGNRIKTFVPGPNKSRVPMEIDLLQANSPATLIIDKKSHALEQGKWSSWIHLEFRLGPLRRVPGMCRFYLDSINPQLRLYMSPLQVDPLKPAFPISYPDQYAAELAHHIGSYSTLGIPEDTNALVDGCLDDEAFLSLCNEIMGEREKMLWHELDQREVGLLALVFDTTDKIQHVYWGTRDPEHPAYHPDYAKKYGSVIEDYYRGIDKILLRVLDCCDERTAIFIVSDHGFASFRRAVHLNSWLAQNGLMALRKPAADTQGAPLFKNVKWENTKAYALGFSSIYLNLKGREGKGIVNPGPEAEKLKGKVASVLLSLRDPKTGDRVIRNVYKREDIYSGPRASEAPDLIVGFDPNYRASWQTAIGGAPGRILEDNLKKWSGDHIIDSACIPGVLLTNQKISISQPRVIDIAPTVLGCFQIPKPESMEGAILLHP